MGFAAEASAEQENGGAAKVLPWVQVMCVAVLLLLGIVVLLGWLVGSRTLTEVVAGRASMKVNTALGFVLSGLALGAYRLCSRLATRMFAGLVMALGVAVMFEFVSGRNLGIDEALFRDVLQPHLPGRMAFVTAVNFCLGGMAVLLLTLGRRMWRWTAVCAVLMLLAALTSIVGYVYGVPVLYGAAEMYGAHSMALHTGLGFMVLAVGVVVAERQSRFYRLLTGVEAGSVLTRRALAGVILGPVLLGWVYLRPGLDFGGPRFGLAIFAATLVAFATTGLLVVSYSLNREARERAGVARALAEGAAAVEQSERELALVTDNLPTLISYLSRDWRFVRVNRTYEVWSGDRADGIVGRSIRELLGDAYWERTRSYRKTVEAGSTVTFEMGYPRAGELRQVMVTYAPDFDEAGMVRGVACMVQDVHEQRLAEGALRQSEKLAVVGRLASSIAHEINNPLESVTNLLYLVGQETEGLQPVSEYVAMAQGELERVTQIVVQTLRFHRQATDQGACRMSELTRQVLALYQGRLTGAGIVVVQDFEQEREMTCWEGEVRQVLANLVGNSVDAMKKGGVLTVRVRAWGTGVMVTTADTGSGMKAETLTKLFEPFYTTKGATGSGLGLWISQEIVERHGGWMKVKSAVGRGTVFRIYLPGVEG